MLVPEAWFRRFAILAASSGVLFADVAAAEPLWKQLTPRPRVEADPAADYFLTETNGPWLIMAATFSGKGAEPQARQLLLELRSDYNLVAYLHRMTFDIASDAPTRGRDRHGRVKRAKYRRGDEVTEFAVLVGDFSSVDDPEAQRILERIKSLEPNALSGAHLTKTTQNLAGLRAMQNLAKRAVGQTKKRGPMGHAFLTRNPMLPRGYFVPKGVDSFVAKMNAGVKHSVLDCPGRFTIQVATFRGRTSIQGSMASKKDSRRRNTGRNPLEVAADDAHNLTVALHKCGWNLASGYPAWEFHDRTESWVAIGSFDEVGGLSPDGRPIPSDEMKQVIRTFGAAFDTPFVTPRELAGKQQADQFKARFSALLSSRVGAGAAGLNPKFLVGIPFDIHPRVREVPRKSISSAYIHE